MKNLLIITIILLLMSSLVFSEKIRILTSEEAPTNYTYKEEFIGTTVDIVKEIKKIIKEDAPIEVLSWSRSYGIAKTTPNIVIFTSGKTQEREELGFNFIGPIFTREHTLYKKKGNTILVKDIQDIKNQNLVVGSMKGDWRSNYFKSEGVKVSEVINHESNVKNLLLGRIDLWALSDIEVPSVTTIAGYTTDEIEPVFIFGVASSYIMLSKGTSDNIVNEWQNALKYIETTEFFDDLKKKWSDILEIELDYSREKGLFIKK